jgi:steroid 5-alpha reductase family enzyme
MQYHLDLLGTGAFALSSILAVMTKFMELPLRSQISTVAVALWSVKLAAFLFFRACKVKTDVRLEGLLSSTSGTSEFYMSCVLIMQSSQIHKITS